MIIILFVSSLPPSLFLLLYFFFFLSSSSFCFFLFSFLVLLLSFFFFLLLLVLGLDVVVLPPPPPPSPSPPPSSSFSAFSCSSHTDASVYRYCVWQTRNRPCGELFNVTVTDLGVCYTFNADRNSPRLHSTDSGPLSGLRIILDIQQDFYYFSMHSQSGIKVFFVVFLLDSQSRINIFILLLLFFRFLSCTVKVDSSFLSRFLFGLSEWDKIFRGGFYFLALSERNQVFVVVFSCTLRVGSRFSLLILRAEYRFSLSFSSCTL